MHRIQSWSHIDKSLVEESRLIGVKEALTIPNYDYTQAEELGNSTKGIPEMEELFEEDDRELRLPRQYGMDTLRVLGGAVSDGRVEHFIPEHSKLFRPRFEAQDVAVQQAVAKLREGDHGAILVAPCGQGKALAHGEPVVVRDGTANVEDLRVGDRVAGVDGGFYPVRGVFPQGVRDLYRVTFTDGSHVDCDADHLWEFELRRDKHKVVVITTDQLMRSPLRGTSGRRFFLPMPEPLRYPERSLPLDPYTLGALLGDGHLSVRSRVLFTTEDEELVMSLSLPPMHRPKKLEHQNSGAASTYLLAPSRKDAESAVPLRYTLERMGLMGCTSHTKFIPLDYLLAAEEQRLAVLQGLFDTDGSAAEGGVVEYSTVSDRLRDGVLSLVTSLGGTCGVSRRTTRYTKQDGSKSEPFPSYRLRAKLPLRFAPFRLARKACRVPLSRQREPYRAVDRVAYLGKREATCISVDSPRHLFLTRNCVPTHNTVMGIEVIRQMRQRTVILVHKEFLRDQWMEELAKFLPEASVGLVQEGTYDWDKDVVLVMIQTLLSKRVYPNKFFQGVGLVVSDEAHRLGAKKWRYAITQFPAKYRLLLTATPERRDGRHVVFERHVGPNYHEMRRTGLRPRVERMELRTYMPADQYTRPSDGQVLLSRVITMLSKNEVRNKKLAKVMWRALQARRQVLVLSDRLEQLDVFRDLLRPKLPSDTVITKFIGGTTKKVRADRARAPDADLILGTFAMAQEGLNIPTMSVLMMATPRADVQQPVGRILRPLEGKGEPVLVDPVDVSVGICIGLAGARWKQYRKLGYA